MGDGPKRNRTERVSRKASVAERLRSGGGELGSPVGDPTDPCTKTRQVTIALTNGRVPVGTPILIRRGTPPVALASGRVVGTLGGSAARAIEACLALGVRFSGEVRVRRA